MNYSICTHWKRALCFVLAFAMLLTLLPVGTLAEGSETVPAADAETTPAPTTAEFTVKFLDWDGTLHDTIGIYGSAIRQTCRHLASF